MKKVLGLILVVMLFVSCGDDISTTPNNFDFEVIDMDGNVQTWNIDTTERTVGDALRTEGLITQTGLITTVNGITADWDADKAYWEFQIDGEYALTGVDDTAIESGVTYAFVYTQG
jgi:hypothetical protein